MTALIRAGTRIAEAYANWSRWVAHCGWCQFGRGELQPCQAHFQCTTCGEITEVIWPSEAMILGVERLLMMRPDPSTRNWLPGETLVDLIRENGEHGILHQFESIAAAAKPGELLFSVDEGRICVDTLPMLKHRVRQEIVGGG